MTPSILDCPADVLVNPVNCVGVMGAGLAKAFADRWPGMLPPYRRACGSGALKPGMLLRWTAPTGQTVIQFPTKRHWRHKSRLNDVMMGIEKLEASIPRMGVSSLAVPMVGCGLGGLEGECREAVKDDLFEMQRNLLREGHLRWCLIYNDAPVVRTRNVGCRLDDPALRVIVKEWREAAEARQAKTSEIRPPAPAAPSSGHPT